MMDWPGNFVSVVVCDTLLGFSSSSQIRASHVHPSRVVTAGGSVDQSVLTFPTFSARLFHTSEPSVLSNLSVPRPGRRRTRGASAADHVCEFDRVDKQILNTKSCTISGLQEARRGSQYRESICPAYRVHANTGPIIGPYKSAYRSDS